MPDVLTDFECAPDAQTGVYSVLRRSAHAQFAIVRSRACGVTVAATLFVFVERSDCFWHSVNNILCQITYNRVIAQMKISSDLSSL